MDWTTACILWNLSRVSNRSLYGAQGTYFVLLWLVECGTHAFFLVQMLIDGLVGADLSYGTFHLTWRPADKKRERHYGVLLQVTPYGVHMVFCC